MKKIVALLVALLMLMSLVACGDSSGKQEEPAKDSSEKADETKKDDEKVTAYFVGIMQGGAAWAAAQKGFEDACEKLGWDGYYVAPSAPNDTTEMVQLAETALTNNTDVLIGTFYSEEIFGDVMKPAFEKGVYIATTNVSVGEDYQHFWIGTDPDGMGEAQANALIDLADGKPVTVVYMQTQMTTETQNQQYARFCEVLADHDNITVYGQEACDSNEVLAAEKISNLVKANPEINACVCADGNGALGIANYVDESGNADDFISVGIDDGADMLLYVLSGALDVTIAQDFYRMGHDSWYDDQNDHGWGRGRLCK